MSQQPINADSLHAAGSAKFTSRGGGASIKTGRGKITVWRGRTESGEDSVAVKMTHESGNQHEFLLTLNGACALSALLDGALSGELSPNHRLDDKSQ